MIIYSVLNSQREFRTDEYANNVIYYYREEAIKLPEVLLLIQLVPSHLYFIKKILPVTKLTNPVRITEFRCAS